MGSESAKQNALADTVNLSGSSLRARLEEIDTEIAALEARLGHLKTTRKPVADALDSIVYPILSIPVEITSLIFACLFDELVYDEDGSWVVNFNDMKRKGPLFLAQICRAWREIVFNTPSMWSRVQAAIDSSTKPLPVKWPDLLRSWLARSGNQPLYLNLLAAKNIVEAEPLFTIAADYSKQWRSFSCSLNDSVCSAIDHIQGRTPLLHELKLDSERGFSPHFLITAFSITPELRKVDFRFLPPICVALPWEQLTHLTLYRRPVVECIDILHQTPLLQALSVDLDPLSPGDLPVPVTLNFLYKLELRGWTQDFYPYVTLPHLSDLRIAVDDEPDGLPAFLTQSQCTVEKLSLEMFNLIKVFAVLALFDEVRDLTFPSESVGLQWEDLAELFVRIATDAMFLPRLESLDVLQYDDVIPYEEMVQMLCARRFDRGSKPKLASFQFIRSVPVEEDPHIYTSDFLHYIRHNSDTVPDTAIVDQLQALIADGLKLRILSWHMSEPLFYTETLSS